MCIRDRVRSDHGSLTCGTCRAQPGGPVLGQDFILPMPHSPKVIPLMKVVLGRVDATPTYYMCANRVLVEDRERFHNLVRRKGPVFASTCNLICCRQYFVMYVHVSTSGLDANQLSS